MASKLSELFKTSGAVAIATLAPDALTELQGLLKDSGYPIAADGQYGPATAKAFETFKASVFQKDPGVIGVSSLDLLRKEAVDRLTGKTPKESTGAVGNSVINVFRKPAPKLTTKILPTGKAVFVEKPILAGGHLSWGEMTKDGYRWPDSAYTEGKIVNAAKLFERVRKQLGNPVIHITSGYRPYAINKAVGGASASRHVVGDAFDFYADGLTIDQMFRSLNGWARDNSVAIAPAYRMGFIHMDDRGHFSTWNYD